MRSKLNELWALVGAVNAARERGRKAGGEATVEWTVVDEEGLKQITQVRTLQHRLKRGCSLLAFVFDLHRYCRTNKRVYNTLRRSYNGISRIWASSWERTAKEKIVT
jgi:hypothetical protein